MSKPQDVFACLFICFLTVGLNTIILLNVLIVSYQLSSNNCNITVCVMSGPFEL